MAYRCDRTANTQLYLDHQGTQTSVTLVNTHPGGQQQSSSSFHTGAWIAAPEVFATPEGVVIELKTAAGKRWIQVQGTQMAMISTAPTLQHPIPLQWVQPMEPMKPMQMGNMEMGFSPMTMKMGNMEMKMGTPATSLQKFCSQCGASVKPEDRFCSSCGHRLG